MHIPRRLLGRAIQLRQCKIGISSLQQYEYQAQSRLNGADGEPFRFRYRDSSPKAATRFI
jgi:hypothetical protein